MSGERRRSGEALSIGLPSVSVDVTAPGLEEEYKLKSPCLEEDRTGAVEDRVGSVEDPYKTRLGSVSGP
jgi:hypothetical protein